MTTRRYWKQFGVWATDLYNKYWQDIFFRTEFNVIVLQIFFALTISIIVIVSFNYLYKDILQTLISGITENILTHGAVSGSDIVNSIEIERSSHFIYVFGIASIVTLIFSYFIARLTLYPARDALKTQKRFISDVAHELRTPLSIIKTNNEVALLEDNFSNSAREIFKGNIEELDRISGIINNLLTFNTLANPEPIKFEVINLGQIVDLSVEKLHELIKTKEIKIVTKKVAPYTVWGNGVALEQIVINIIKNAINYNHVGGKVEIKLEPDYRGSVVLQVEDTGIGISQNDLLHIFEPFFHADKSRHRTKGTGSGLGLTIVSELVKMHSAKINVKSRLKQGTTVTIVFPYTRNSSGHDREDKGNSEISMSFLKKN